MPWNGSGDFSLSDTIAPATNADANELQAILTDIGTGIDASINADGQSTITGALKGADGTAALPAYSFSADLNSGFYRIGSDNVGLSLGGTKRVDFLTTGISITGTLTASGQILSSDGTKTAPGYSFSGDVDTGVYRIGANNLGISCGDTKIFDITTAGATLTGAYTVSSTLGVTGDFAVATNKFTVASASGNTAVAGTLNVTGVITGAHAAPTVQRFTSGTGTYTASAGAVRVRVRMVGGGGGGGARTTNNGTAGGNTTFEAWAATGGGLGTLAGAGGTGGVSGANGTGTLIIRCTGADGGVSAMQTDATGDSQAVFTGGPGGSSVFGGAGMTIATGGGAAKTNSGSGGAGGTSSTTTKGGGGGGAGEYVEFWMTAAQATGQSYAVGAAGSGGSAGGSAGGNGAAGIIIVEEYYS